MKYKKLLVLITCLLFVTVAVFCFASAFKITSLEIRVTAVENSSENLSFKCEEVAKKYEGSNLVFIDTDDIKKELSDISGYVNVVSVEKQFPSKLLIEVEERKEVFVVASGNDFYALDVDLRVLAKKDSIKNNIDGKDNLILNISEADFNKNVTIGEILSIYDNTTSNYLLNVSNLLAEYKNDIASVSVTVKKDGVDYKTVTLIMKEGVKFTISKSDVESYNKIKETYEFYLELENKGAGEYITVLEDNGKITVKQ